MTEAPEQHRNDIYAADDAEPGTAPPIPAATVVVLRQRSAAPQVLMLRKSSKISFGGMWVFPGGRIDDEDYPEDRDLESAARVAAAREAAEEAAVVVRPEDFVWFAHWTPPPTSPKRFATFFFATLADEGAAIEIDGGEIREHAWISPKEALARHRSGDIDLAPPTWVTLFQLSRQADARRLLASLAERSPRYYATRVGKRRDGVRVAIWQGDAGYDSADADAEGPRHRLVMARDGFVFEYPDDAY